MTVELDIGLQPDVRAPARARRAVRTLRGVIPSDRIDDLELLVSELVSNAVQHAVDDRSVPAWIRMRVATRTDRIDVAVTDPGNLPTTPALRDPQDGHVAGWGLVFVDRLSSAWGVQEGNEGTTVWFELPLDDGHEVGRRSPSGLTGLLLG